MRRALNKKLKISLIICTRNRAQTLSDCLQSIKDYWVFDQVSEILVIDNNSSDQTNQIVSDFKHKIKPNDILYFKENEIGLSHARNRAIKESSATWLFYIDDDAKITDDFQKQLYKTLGFEFEAFTGTYIPYYIKEKPKWLSENFGRKKIHATDIGPISIDGMCGSAFGIKTEIIKSVGGFPLNMGMNDSTIAYGEETYVEKLLQLRNYTIGINPHLIVEHLVDSRKYKFRWHLRSAIAMGKGEGKLPRSNSNLDEFFLDIKHLLRHIIRKSPSIIFNLGDHKSYSPKYKLLLMLQPFLHFVGKWIIS